MTGGAPIPCLKRTATGLHVLVVLDLSAAERLSSARSVRVARNLFIRHVRRLGGHQVGETALVLPQSHALDAKLDELEAKVLAVALPPLSAQRVQTMLGISKQERQSWTNSGRLPAMTKSVAGRSIHQIATAQYSAALILDLLDNPDRIAAWRAYGTD